MVEADVESVLAKFGITGMVAAIIMIVFGILVIIFPHLIAWIVGLYLIVVGLINLMGHFQTTQSRPPMARPVDKFERRGKGQKRR
jgi:uncharacterized membrane protein HdeD (DUF308 family)